MQLTKWGMPTKSKLLLGFRMKETIHVFCDIVARNTSFIGSPFANTSSFSWLTTLLAPGIGGVIKRVDDNPY